jgi:predicted metal-dependent peptidase
MSNEELDRKIATFTDENSGYTRILQFMNYHLVKANKELPLAGIGWDRDRLHLHLTPRALALPTHKFKGLIMHELGHVMLLHFSGIRRMSLNLIWTSRGVDNPDNLHSLNNVVMDLEINGSFVPMEDLPEGGQFASDYGWEFGLLAEEYARLVPLEFKENADGGKDWYIPGIGDPGDILDGEFDEIDELTVREWTKEIKTKGNLPIGAEALINKIYEPPDIQWASRIHKTVVDIVRSQSFSTSYGRENRRYADSPGKIYKKSPKAWAVFDTSGSMMTDWELGICSATLTKLRRYFSGLTVIINDSAIHEIYDLRPGQVITKVRGGGGSDFTKVIEHIEGESRGKKSIVFLLTDGQIEVPRTPPPNLSFVWILTAEANIPYGESIVIRK